MSGAAAGAATAAGNVALVQPIAGAGQGSGAAAGHVDPSAAIAGDGFGAGAADGDVTLDQALAGGATGAGQAAGAVARDTSVTGAAAGSGQAAGGVDLTQGMAGAAAAAGAAAGQVDLDTVRENALPDAVGLFDPQFAAFKDATGWTTGAGISFDTSDDGKAVFDGSQPSQTNFQRTTDRPIEDGHELVAYAEVRRTAGQVSSLQVGGGGSDTFGTGAIATSRNAVRRATVTSASRTVGRAVVSADFEGEIRKLQFHDIQARLDGPLDIYICAGQSNMAGLSSVTGANLDIDVVEPRALYVPSKTFNALGAETDGTGTSINANLSSSEGIGSALLCVEPIQHAKADNSAGVSPVTSISTAICNGGVSGGRTAIFVACAAGGTRLLPSGGEWNPSGTDSRYYDLMVAQVNALLALNGSNVVKGMFWCQGESDGATGYAAAFNTMASGLRTLYGSFPIVIMEVGGTVAASAAMVAEQQKLATGSGDVSELANCAYVPRRPGAALEADSVHYTATAQRDRGADAGERMLQLIYPGTQGVSGAALGTGQASGAIAAQGAQGISGAAQATGQAGGAVDVDQSVAGAAAGQAAAAGAVDLQQGVGGAAVGAGQGGGAVDLDQSVAGNGSGQGVAQGAVDLQQGVGGGIAGQGTASGGINLQQSVAGDASGTASASGSVQGDTVAPVINSDSYNNGTETLQSDITDTAASVTIFWASVQNPSAPSEAQIEAGSGGGVLDSGSFTASTGADSNVIDLTDPLANEIHYFARDPSGNDSAIRVVTGVVVAQAIQGAAAGAAAAAGDVAAGSAQISVVDSSVQTGALGAADTYTFANVTLAAGDILVMWFAMEDSADAGVDNPSGSVSWGGDSWPSGGTNNWSVVRNRTQGISNRVGVWANTAGVAGTNDLTVVFNDGPDHDITIGYAVIRNGDTASDPTTWELAEAVNPAWPYTNASVSVGATGLMVTIAGNGQSGTFSSSTEGAAVQQDTVPNDVAGAMFARRVTAGTETVNVGFAGTGLREYVEIFLIPEA